MLNREKLVARPARLYFISSTIDPMCLCLAVKAAAIEAYVSESDRPRFALFEAAQSLAPSPQKPTTLPKLWYIATTFDLS